jgi:hypothetical protein
MYTCIKMMHSFHDVHPLFPMSEISFSQGSSFSKLEDASFRGQFHYFKCGNDGEPANCIVNGLYSSKGMDSVQMLVNKCRLSVLFVSEFEFEQFAV